MLCLMPHDELMEKMELKPSSLNSLLLFSIGNKIIYWKILVGNNLLKILVFAGKPYWKGKDRPFLTLTSYVRSMSIRNRQLKE